NDSVLEGRLRVRHCTRRRSTDPTPRPAHAPPTPNCCSAGSGSWRPRPRRTPPPPSGSSAGSPTAAAPCSSPTRTPPPPLAFRPTLPLLPGQLPQQAALLHQLQQQVGHLQQKVVGRPARVAVGVLQVQAAVLLRVKPLVLLTPTLTPAPRRHFRHRVAIDRQRRHPRPLRPLRLVGASRERRGGDLPCPPPAALVAQVVPPAEALLALRGRPPPPPLPRTDPHRPRKAPPQRRRPPLLEHVQVVTAVVPGDLEPRAAGKLAISDQANP